MVFLLIFKPWLTASPSVRAAPAGTYLHRQFFRLLMVDRTLHRVPQCHYRRVEPNDTLPTQHDALYRMVRLSSLLSRLIKSSNSCGVPLFANATTTKCKQCEKEVPLRINPRLVHTTSSTIPPNLPTQRELTLHFTRLEPSSTSLGPLAAANSSGQAKPGNNFWVGLRKIS